MGNDRTFKKGKIMKMNYGYVLVIILENVCNYYVTKRLGTCFTDSNLMKKQSKYSTTYYY